MSNLWGGVYGFIIPCLVYMVIFVQRRRMQRVGAGTRFRRRLHFALPFRFLRMGLTYVGYVFMVLLFGFGIQYIVSHTVFASQFTIQKIVYDS